MEYFPWNSGIASCPPVVDHFLGRWENSRSILVYPCGPQVYLLDSPLLVGSVKKIWRKRSRMWNIPTGRLVMHIVPVLDGFGSQVTCCSSIVTPQTKQNTAVYRLTQIFFRKVNMLFAVCFEHLFGTQTLSELAIRAQCLRVTTSQQAGMYEDIPQSLSSYYKHHELICSMNAS